MPICVSVRIKIYILEITKFSDNMTKIAFNLLTNLSQRFFVI